MLPPGEVLLSWLVDPDVSVFAALEHLGWSCEAEGLVGIGGGACSMWRTRHLACAGAQARPTPGPVPASVAAAVAAACEDPASAGGLHAATQRTPSLPGPAQPSSPPCRVLYRVGEHVVDAVSLPSPVGHSQAPARHSRCVAPCFFPVVAVFLFWRVALCARERGAPQNWARPVRVCCPHEARHIPCVSIVRNQAVGAWCAGQRHAPQGAYGTSRACVCPQRPSVRLTRCAAGWLRALGRGAWPALA